MHKVVSLLEAKSHSRFEFTSLRDILMILSNLTRNDENKDRVGSTVISLLFAILQEPVLSELELQHSTPVGSAAEAPPRTPSNSRAVSQKDAFASADGNEEHEEEHEPSFAGVGHVSVKRLAAENILSLMFSEQVSFR
jgi:hypothetical protein